MKLKARAPDPMRRRLLVGILATGSAQAMLAATPILATQRQTLMGQIRDLLDRPGRHDAQLVALARQIVYAGEEPDFRWKRCSDAQLARTIRANIMADYRTGRIVDESRWQISATEACALRLMRCLETGAA